MATATRPVEIPSRVTISTLPRDVPKLQIYLEDTVKWVTSSPSQNEFTISVMSAALQTKEAIRNIPRLQVKYSNDPLWNDAVSRDKLLTCVKQINQLIPAIHAVRKGAATSSNIAKLGRSSAQIIGAIKTLRQYLNDEA